MWIMRLQRMPDLFPASSPHTAICLAQVGTWQQLCFCCISLNKAYFASGNLNHPWKFAAQSAYPSPHSKYISATALWPESKNQKKGRKHGDCLLSSPKSQLKTTPAAATEDLASVGTRHTWCTCSHALNFLGTRITGMPPCLALKIMLQYFF